MKKEAMIERAQEALRLRREGKTFAEVGLSLAQPVGAARARQLVVHAEQIEQGQGFGQGEWYEGLSVRAANALRSAGFDSKGEVFEAIKSGDLTNKGGMGATYRGAKVHGLGCKSFAEVCEWVGVDIPMVQRKHYRPLTEEEKIKGAIRLLKRAGYSVTRIDPA